jgi:hypothetical protein
MSVCAGSQVVTRTPERGLRQLDRVAPRPVGQNASFTVEEVVEDR